MSHRHDPADYVWEAKCRWDGQVMTGVDEESNGTDPEACPPSLSEVYKKVARYICRTADPAGISLGARIKPLANVTKSDLQQHPG